MRGSARARWVGLLLVCALPALAADPAAKNPAPANAAAAAKPAAKPPAEPLAGLTATILDVKPDRLLVVRSGSSTDLGKQRVFDFAVGPNVKVSGAGRSAWKDLKQGDAVLVSYVDGEKPTVKKVNVLARTVPVDKLILAAAGMPVEKPAKRTFIGYIKKKDGDVLYVMRPRSAPPANRPSQVKTFVRQKGTRVGVLRDSWDGLKKGDRVKIEFEKGSPRPADLVQVIWRGGEKPLPPGVATRLFDPTYDKSVKDVDGIGETGPLPANFDRLTPERKVKIKLPRT